MDNSKINTFTWVGAWAYGFYSRKKNLEPRIKKMGRMLKRGVKTQKQGGQTHIQSS